MTAMTLETGVAQPSASHTGHGHLANNESLIRLLEATPKAFTRQQPRRASVLEAAARVVCVATTHLPLGEQPAKVALNKRQTELLRKRCREAALAVYPHLVSDAWSLDASTFRRSRRLFVDLSEFLGVSAQQLAKECEQQTGALAGSRAPASRSAARRFQAAQANLRTTEWWKE